MRSFYVGNIFHRDNDVVIFGHNGWIFVERGQAEEDMCDFLHHQQLRGDRLLATVREVQPGQVIGHSLSGVIRDVIESCIDFDDIYGIVANFSQPASINDFIENTMPAYRTSWWKAAPEAGMDFAIMLYKENRIRFRGYRDLLPDAPSVRTKYSIVHTKFWLNSPVDGGNDDCVSVSDPGWNR